MSNWSGLIERKNVCAYELIDNTIRKRTHGRNAICIARKSKRLDSAMRFED
jgi:hypothetical protein